MTTPLRGLGQIISPIERGNGLPLGVGQAGAPFGDLLKKAIGDVQGAQQVKDDTINAFLRGEPVELHQVMAAAEEASLSLEFLVETRNKLTEAYRTIMNVQA
jgi:flagellar hook-basal body complex protein FliE